MSDRLSDEVGRRVMTGDDLAAALIEYTSSHPGANVAAVRSRMARLNQEAIERDAAQRAGTTVEAMRAVQAESAARRSAARAAEDLRRARLAVKKANRITVDERPIDRIRTALREWQGEWPPTQPAILDVTGWADARSIRAACERAGTTWADELRAVERNRPDDQLDSASGPR